jgi:OOP family OmpA-OmpF porin
MSVKLLFRTTGIALLWFLFFVPKLNAQQMEWASSVDYDNNISNKDGYNARKVTGPPDVETYGRYSRNGATFVATKTASLWLNFKSSIPTHQILILESNGGGNLLKVELVDELSGNTTTVFESPAVKIQVHYRLTRIVLPDKSMKTKQLKLKFTALADEQQVDAVAVTDSDELFTLESLLGKYAVKKPVLNPAGQDEALVNVVSLYNPANTNVLNVVKEQTALLAGLKPGESGNMGGHVNSVYDEIAPIISADEQTLFFIRVAHPLNTRQVAAGSEDIWYTEFDKKTQTWGDAKHLAEPFNSTTYNKIVGVTPDGNTRLIKGAYENGIYRKTGFSFSYRTLNGWSAPEQIKLKGYESMTRGTHIGSYLPNNGKTLLLSLSEEEGSENNDLYVSFIQEDGKWTRPVSLGKTLNTKYNEDTPFLASDGVSLYFASDRPGGLGKRDIYLTRREDDTWLHWSEPVNLGPTINTSGDDANYSIAASGLYAYMVSTRNSIGGTDIVRMKLKDEIKPNPVVLITGHVLNQKTNKPLAASISYQLLPEGGEAGIAHSNPADGSYKIVLSYGKNYGFQAKADSFLAVSDNLDLSTVAEYKEITRDLYLVPVEVGEVLRLNNIFFDLGKSTLRDESVPELSRLLKYMVDNPALEIELAGHTDDIGTDEANKLLSEERAKAVKTYLCGKGIAESRIRSIGFGESKPIADNHTEEGRQMNRRLEFSILKK